MAWIAARLRARLDELIATMVARMRDTADERRTTDARPASSDLMTLLRQATTTFIELLANDRVLAPEEVAMLQSFGVQRAREGVPLTTLTAVVRVAATVGWDYIVEAALELPPSPATTAALGRTGELLAGFAGATVRAVTDGYSGSGGVGGREARAQALAALLSGHGAVTGVPAHLDATPSTTTEHVLLLVAAPRPDDDRTATRRAVDMLLAQLDDAIEIPLTSVSTGHASLVIALHGNDAAMACRDIAAAVARSCEVVIFGSGVVRSTAALSGAYRRAVGLLRVARRTGDRGYIESRPLRVSSLLLHGATEHAEFLDETVGVLLGLPEAQRAPLLRTLEVLSTLPSRAGMRDAAAALNVHLKTVYYRLDRVRELTGLDWDVPADRLQLSLAVVLLGLADTSRGARSGSDDNDRATRSRPAPNGTASLVGRAARTAAR